MERKTQCDNTDKCFIHLICNKYQIHDRATKFFVTFNLSGYTLHKAMIGILQNCFIYTANEFTNLYVICASIILMKILRCTFSIKFTDLLLIRIKVKNPSLLHRLNQWRYVGNNNSDKSLFIICITR